MESSVPNHDDESIGARIASYRNLAGYTQREFAEYSHLSLGNIRKVERGERLPTHGFLATAARTLAMTVEELTGQPYRGRQRFDEKAHAPIAAIRSVVRAFDLPPEWRTAPRPLGEIADDLAEATRHRAAARYTRLGLALPELLEELTAAVHLLEGGRRRQAAKMLASAYYMAHCLTYRLGYADLSGQLDDRQRWAADLSGDALAVALAQWSRAGGFQAAREYGAGLRLLAHARDQLTAEAGASSPSTVTLLGSLRLREATLASRARDEQATEHHLTEASRLAEQMPDRTDRVHYHLTFGPANVAVHDIAAQVELGRFLKVAAWQFEAGCTAPEMFSPVIDGEWHRLLSSSEYQEFCAEHAGRQIGHAPNTGVGEISWVQVYEELFGPLPDIWFTDQFGRLDHEGLAR